MTSVGITATLIVVLTSSDSATSKFLISPLYYSLPSVTPVNPNEVGYMSKPSSLTHPWLMIVLVDPESITALTLCLPATNTLRWGELWAIGKCPFTQWSTQPSKIF